MAYHEEGGKGTSFRKLLVKKDKNVLEIEENKFEPMDNPRTKEEMQKKFDDLDKLRLGATGGKHPAEKLPPQDDGEIRFSIGLSMDKKRVVINFGKTVKWVAMERNQAISIGNALIKTARVTVT